jgi:hypothetical protein
MASIHKEVLLNAAPDLVWDALQDLGALHTRLVPGFVIATRLEPGARVVTFANDQVVRELIIDVDATQRRVAWAIVDAPFRHYNASAQVLSESSGGCRFVWVADLLPDELREQVSQMMDQGLKAIASVFGAKGSR